MGVACNRHVGPQDGSGDGFGIGQVELGQFIEGTSKDIVVLDSLLEGQATQVKAGQILVTGKEFANIGDLGNIKAAEVNVR